MSGRDLQSLSRQAKEAAKRPHALRRPAAASPDAREFSAEDILDKAEELVETGQYEMAVRFCDKVLATDADDARALEIKALASLELGQTDAARALLQQAVAIEPEAGHSKFMYLAQLSEGQAAVEAFSAGISLLHTELEHLMASQADMDPDELADQVHACSQEISTAFCSVAEIYLSDLCHEDGAQDACISCAEKALAYDPRNVQAMQTMANLSISLQHPEAALSWLQQSVALWHKAQVDQDALDNGADEVIEHGADADDADDDQLIDPPAYLFRINTVKLLVELQQYDTALEILDNLVAEDENVTQVWYLLGWVHHLQEDLPTAAGYFVKTKAVYAAMECDDVQILEHVNELMAGYPAFAEPIPEF